MKFTKLTTCLKTLSVLTLICCFALTATAQNYYPSDIGNTWIFLSADGSEQRTYTLESPEDTDIGGLIALKITTVALGTDAASTDTYFITAENDGSLLLHESAVDLGLFGISEATYAPPVTFFPAELPVGRSWQIVAETQLQLVGPVTSTSTITVAAIEDVQTPAGLFKDCVKLEINQRDVTALAVLRQTTYQWLAPDVGPVKYINDQEVLYELESYDLVEPAPPAEPHNADINGDGVINILDLVFVAEHFGTAEKAADINGDGVVNILDLVIIAAQM